MRSSFSLSVLTLAIAMAICHCVVAVHVQSVLGSIPAEGATDDCDCSRKFGDASTFNSSTRRCVVAIGEPCDESWPKDEYQCGPDAELGGRCLNGVCDCGRDHMEVRDWDGDLGRGDGAAYICVERGLIGSEGCWRGSCRVDLTCESHKTEHGSIRSNCTCNGFWNATDGYCRSDGYCSDIQGMGYDGYFDQSTGLCTCRVDGPCLTVPAICPRNSVLQMETIDGASVPSCTCNPGFKSVIMNQYCAEPREYGEPCEHEVDPAFMPSFSGRVQCGMDVKDGSLCIQGKCQCRPEAEYWDPVRGRCVGIVGAYCGGSDEYCTTNAVCPDKWCECPSKYRAHDDGRCDK